MPTPLRATQIAALVSSAALMAGFVGYRIWSARQREARAQEAQAAAQPPRSDSAPTNSIIPPPPPPVTTKRGTMVEPRDVERPVMFSSSKSGEIVAPKAPLDRRPMLSGSKSALIVEPENDPPEPAPPPVMFSGSKSGYIWNPETAKAFEEQLQSAQPPSSPTPPRLTFTHASSSKVAVLTTPDDPIFDFFTKRPTPPRPIRSQFNLIESPFWAGSFWWWQPPGQEFSPYEILYFEPTNPNDPSGASVGDK